MFYMIILSAAVSIDSFGIGVSYGIRKIKISFPSFVIMTAVSLCICITAAFLGFSLPLVLTEELSGLIGSILLMTIGVFIIYQAKEENPERNAAEGKNRLSEKDKKQIRKNKKIFSFLIRGFGITASIIKKPERGDMDNSKTIEPKEAVFIAAALSADSVGAAAGAGAQGISPAVFAAMICLAQIIFITAGCITGKRIRIKDEKRNIVSLISGAFLILLGAYKTAEIFIF